MIKKSSISACLIAIPLTLALTGCGENAAARATSEALLENMFKRTAKSPEEFEMFTKMDDYKNAVSCFTESLSGSGWTQEQHEMFMTDSGGTGDFQKIDKNKQSEQELMAKYGAISVATAACF